MLYNYVILYAIFDKPLSSVTLFVLITMVDQEFMLNKAIKRLRHEFSSNSSQITNVICS